MLATGSRAQGEEANGNVTASVLTWLNVTHSCAKLVRKLRIWGQILRKGVLGPEGSTGSPLGPSELGEGAAVGEKGRMRCGLSWGQCTLTSRNTVAVLPGVAMGTKI